MPGVAAFSSALGPVQTKPINTVAPLVSGVTVPGDALSVTTGTWTAIPSATYTYQWQRLIGVTWANIVGETAALYTVIETDLGTYLRCVVTATNFQGSTAATSNSLGPVASGLQFNIPDLVTEVAFVNAPSDTVLTWVDISPYVREIHTARGRQFELDRIEAGTTTYVLDNSDRRFDPANVSGPYYPNVLPMRRIRSRVPNGAGVDGGTATVTGGVVTDASRNNGTAVDGLEDDSSFGIWQGTTNLIKRGTFTTVFPEWVGKNATETLSIGLQPSDVGYAALQVVTPGSVPGEGTIYHDSGTACPVTGSLPYTFSTWAQGTVPLQFVIIEYDVSNSVVATHTSPAFTPGTTFDRHSYTITTNASATHVEIAVLTTTAVATTFYIVGCQFEQRRVVTPYVPTVGATAARANADVQFPVTLLGSSTTQGWIAIRCRADWASSAPPDGGTGVRYLFRWGDDTNNRISVVYDEASSSFFADRLVGGVRDRALIARAIATGDELTVILCWTATTIGLSVNGSAFTTTVGSHVPTLAATTFNVGSGSSGVGSWWDGEIRWVAFGTGTIENTDASFIGGFGNADHDPVSYIWPGSCTAVWPAVTSTYRVPADAYLCTGYVERWPQTWDVRYIEVPLTATDGFEPLNQSSLVSAYASFTTAIAGSNNNIVWTSVAPGPGGNYVSIQYIVAGISTPLSVSTDIASLTITVNVRTDGAGLPSVTANEILGLVNADALAGDLVQGVNAPGSDGTGIVGGVPRTNLSGGTFVQQLSGTRINAVLDSLGVPAGTRNIDAGQSMVEATSFQPDSGTSSLAHIQDVADSELGLFFYNAEGWPTFHDRNRRYQAPYTTSQATFGDADAELEFSDLVPSFDKDLITNEWRGTRSGGVTQVAQDATSIANFFRRTQTRSPLLVDDGQVLSQMQALLHRYKDPHLRFDSLTFQPIASARHFEQALLREISDRVTVDTTPAGLGTTIVQDCYIERIQIDVVSAEGGTPEWSVSWQLSPADQAFFVLDDVTTGRLDYNALAY